MNPYSAAWTSFLRPSLTTTSWTTSRYDFVVAFQEMIRDRVAAHKAGFIRFINEKYKLSVSTMDAELLDDAVFEVVSCGESFFSEEELDSLPDMSECWKFEVLSTNDAGIKERLMSLLERTEDAASSTSGPYANRVAQPTLGHGSGGM